MKPFLKYLSILLFITLILMVVMDFLYTYVYETSIPRNKTQYVLHLKNQKIDYVFLGSSRVQNNIVTKLVKEKTGSKTINLGIQGGRLDDVNLLLKVLVQNNNRLGKVFIQVDYLYNFEVPSTIVGCESLPYIRTNKIVRDHVRENNLDFIPNYFIPFYRYNVNDFKIGFREFFSSLINKKSKLDLSDGVEPQNGEFKGDNYSLPDKIAKKNHDFSKIDEFCKENKIEVVYFCAPFCSRASNLQYIEKLKTKVPNLVDFSRVIKSDVYFKDCAHLNGAGAEKFTNILIDSCLISNVRMKK